MSGSKKGEKRGAAGRLRNQQLGISEVKREARKKGERGLGRATEDYYRQVVKIVNGDDLARDEPRELMLKAMHYFQDSFEEDLARKRDLIWQLSAMTPEQLQALPAERLAAIELELNRIEGSIKANLLQAVECGFKVAPYLHPRLSAIATVPATGTATNIIARLIAEIDHLSRGRPSWQLGETLELSANTPTAGAAE